MSFEWTTISVKVKHNIPTSICQMNYSWYFLQSKQNLVYKMDRKLKATFLKAH